MEIQSYGANCILLHGKNARVVIDDNLADLGGKTIAKVGDLALFTGVHGSPAQQPKILIDQPGEYEVSGVSIYGIAAQAHLDESNVHNATMYKIVMDDLRILVTGHIYPALSDAQLESIGMIDVMIVPVGGNGYTLDPVGAAKIVKAVDPKLVIPTHYEKAGLNYQVSQQPLSEALKVLELAPKEVTSKLKLKPSELGETLQLVVLES